MVETEEIVKVILKELCRQAQEDRPNTPYVDEMGPLGRTIIDGHVDLHQIAWAIEDALND